MEGLAEKLNSAVRNQLLEANALQPKESTAFQIIQFPFIQTRQRNIRLKEN